MSHWTIIITDNFAARDYVYAN